MALCPACFVTDKNFFAPKCHACNTRIPFLTQVVYSFLATVFAIGFFFGFFWAFDKIFG